MASLSKCIKCDKAAIVEGLCRTHYIEKREEEWLDNSDPKNLGIVKWIHDLMPEFANSATPWFHNELFLDLLGLYNPEYRNKYERLYEFISFRESAKSTAANTLFVSYIIAHNGKQFKYTVDGEVKLFTINEKLIVILSETGGSAEDFTVRIRDVFSTSERLRYYYQFAIQDAIDSDTGQWTRTAFKINGTYVQAVGTGQQIRGKVKGVSRPTLIIADDIYSENNTVTEERRIKIKKWWNNSAVNTVDSLMGKIVVLGTILHDDTIIVELEKNPQWKHKKVPVMPLEKFHKFVQEHTKIDWDSSICTLPFDEIEDNIARKREQKRYFDKVQGEYNWDLAWPERIDLFYLAIKWQEAVYNRSTSGLYQEYFHITTSPLDKKFRPEYFQTLGQYELKYEFGYNWIRLNGDDKWHNCTIEFGIDLSGGKGDDACISVVAALPDMRLLVLHQAIGKWSLRDDVDQDTAQDLRFNKVITNRDAISRVGIVDETFRLAVRYRPSRIKVGVAGEEEQVVDLMRQVFQSNRLYTTIISPRPQTSREGKKETRIMNTLLPFYETRMVYHAGGLTKLEYQLEYLGKSNHDDCADSMECAVWQLDFPFKISIDLFSSEKNTPVQGGADLTAKHLIPNYQPEESFLAKNWRWYGS